MTEKNSASVSGIVLFVSGVALFLALAWVLKRNTPSQTETPSSATVSSATSEVRAPIPMAHVRGVVRLRDGFDPPKYDPSPTSRAGSSWPENCTPPKASDAVPYTYGHGRTLGRVPVIATGMDGERWPASEGPVTVDVRIDDCRLNPQTLIAMRGDTLRLTNNTQWPFFPGLGEAVTRSLLRGEPREMPLQATGLFPIECPVMGACGRTDVVVLNHRVATLTNDVGEFSLDVPAGQVVSLMVLHPLFEATVASVNLDVGQTREIEFAMGPPPPPVPDPGRQIP